MIEWTAPLQTVGGNDYGGSEESHLEIFSDVSDFL